MSMGKNEEIILNQDRSVEAQLQRAKEERQKKLKKQKRRKIILIIAAVAIVLFIVIVSSVISAISKNMPMTVFTTSPTRGDLESTVMASGTIESENVMHYYAPANILVAETVGVGDAVKEGEVMLLFDAEDYAFVLRETELEHQITDNTYQSSLYNYNDVKQNLASANADIKKYQDLVNAQQAVVDELTRTITDENAIRMAKLQNSLYEAQLDINEYNYYILNAESLGLSPEAVETYMSYVREKEKLIASLNYEMSYLSSSEEAYQDQKALTEAQNVLSDYKAELERAKAEAESCQNALGNQYDAENIVLNGELSTMRTQQSYDEVLACQEGVKAEFDGVVSVANVEAGAKTVAGAEMFTLSSTDDVKVTFTVNKSGLEDIALGQKAVIEIMDNEYEGTVTHIDSMAVAGSNGGTSIAVEVHIDNPDDRIYLGLDAKIELFTASVENVVMLPVEAVSADKEGEFVYLVVNGIVEKRYVTLGISSDEYVEIVEGVAETDQVITMVSSEIEAGMPVMAIPEMSDADMEMLLEGME